MWRRVLEVKNYLLRKTSFNFALTLRVKKIKLKLNLKNK